MRQYGLNFYLQPVRLFSYWRWYLADYSEGDVVYRKCEVGVASSLVKDHSQIINNLGFNVAFDSTRSILPVDRYL